MDTKRRIVCFLLMLAMAAGMVPSAAFAVETGEGPAIAAGTNNASPAECLCNAPCTPEAVNQACPVCGAEGADLANCAGKAPAAPSGGEEGNTPPPAGSACTCTEQCGEENRNDDCPVCGAEGADLASCAAAPQGDQVPPATCTCTQPCAPDSVNADCPVCGADGADLAHCAAAILGMNGAISPMSATGSGTEMDPFLIYTQEDLAGIASGSSGKYYKLANDITLTSDWVPIVSFSGTLDGGGYTISGLNVPGSSTPNLGGIVNSLKAGATIKNLNVNGSVTSNYASNARVGGIVGYNYGTVDNCTFSGSVTGSKMGYSNNGAIGGIVGRSDGTITGCINNADVSGQGKNDLYVGGITGSNHGALANCTNTGTISGTLTDGGANQYCGEIWGSTKWETDGGYVGGIAGDTTANAANTGNTNAGEVIYNDQTVVEAHKHDDVHFTQALNSNTLTGGDLAPGNYYLTGDIDLSADGKNAVSIQITGTVNLCLNGHSIRSNASAGIFRIGAGGELNVYDCNGSEEGNGMITETGKTDHNPIFLHSGGTLRLYGGKIEAYRTAIVIDEDPAADADPDMTGGTVYIHGGTVSSTGTGYQAIKVNANMTDTAVYIQGGTVTSNNRGISAESGEIHISGGTVSGSNYALEASNSSTSTVYLSGTPTLSGGSADVKISPASAADKAVLVLKDADTAYAGAGLSIYSNDETNCENKYVARGVAEADMAKGFSLVYPEGYSLEYDADNKAIQIKKRISYAVTLPTGDGYTATAASGSASPVAEGGSYSFTLEISEGYYKTTAFAVKANGTVLAEKNGVYTISNIHENQNVTVQGVARDNTAPTVTIHLEENKWSAFPSSHAFSLFFKNAQTVEITATDDAGSGVAGTEYFVSDVSYASLEALEAAAKKQWKTYSNSFTIAPNSKNVIYAKATDKMGNVGYASSAGIVLYTDSQQDTQSISFTKTGTDAVTADVTLNGNTVDEIYCGSDMLTAGTDYTVSGGTITFYASWLNTLSAGNHTLMVHYNPLGVLYVADAGNDAPGTTSIALSVSKAVGSVTITNDISKVYDGEPVTVTYQTLSTGKVTVEYKAKTADDSAYTANTPSAVGDYTVRVTVAADDNYTAASATKNFTIRYLEAPENPYTLSGENGDNGWYTSDVTITPPEGYTVSSTLPGEYAEKLTIDESADGVTIYLKNQQGQMTDAITVSEIKIDKDDPTITATGDTANYLQSDTVTISASDGTSGVAKVEVRKDGGDFEEITDSYSYTVTENGSYTFRVTDHAGRTKETTLVYDKLDAKTPVVTIIATTDDAEAYTSDTWTNKTITLTPENNTQNLGETTYQYRVGSGEWQRYTGPVVVDADTAAEGAVYAFKATSASGVESSEVSITVKRDAEAPSGDIAIEKVSIRQSLGNGIAFDLFYNKDVEITIRGEDTLSGVNSIQYYRSTEILTEDALAAVTGWENYHDQPIQETAKDAVKFVYYVKVTDNAGNVTRFGSKGVTFDLTPPQISGVDDDSTYYTTQKVEVTDANLQSVTLNDAPDTFENNQLTLTGNMEAAYTYTIKAVDKAGNEREITVFMKPIQSLAEDIAGLTKENVTADDRDAIVAVQTAVSKVDTEHATVAEKDALQGILDRCEELLKKLDEVKREIADVTGAVASYEKDTVKSSDRGDIESLIQRIDSLLDGKNLTDSEREALDQARESAEGLLEQITATANEIAAVTDAVDSYEKDTVKSSDKDDIESLIQRIDSLLAGENLTDSEREALDQARESAEGLLEQITATANEIAAVTDAVDSYEKDTVKSSDKDDIESLIQRIDSLLAGENLTDSEQEALEQARESAKGLLEQIHEATQASNTEHIQSAQEIEPNQAAPKDKANLEAAKGDIEKALNDYADNYTEAEKERLQEILQQIEEALKVIQRIEDMAGSVVLLPEIVIVDDIQGERRSYADREQHTQEDALQAQEGLVAQRMGYHIIEGNGSSWTKGSAQGATFIADGPYSKFTGIAIDGIAISGENYTAESGSTVITLSPDYLNTLSEADHAIAVLYTDGEALGTFTIAGGAAETSASGQADSARPAAGTAAQVIPWIILLVILILVGIMLALRASRKKKMPE